MRMEDEIGGNVDESDLKIWKVTWKAGSPGGIWPVSVNMQSSLLSCANLDVGLWLDLDWFDMYTVWHLESSHNLMVDRLWLWRSIYLLWVRRAVRVHGGSQQETKYHWTKIKRFQFLDFKLVIQKVTNNCISCSCSKPNRFVQDLKENRFHIFFKLNPDFYQHSIP